MRAFETLHPIFETDMRQSEFKDAIEQIVGNSGLTPITFFAMVKGKMQAIGMGLYNVRGRIWQTERVIVFPWARKRNVLEGYVNFVNTIRNEINQESGQTLVLYEFSDEKSQKFFDHVCKYGIMNRVGTSLDYKPNSKTAIYESRSKK